MVWFYLCWTDDRNLRLSSCLQGKQNNRFLNTERYWEMTGYNIDERWKLIKRDVFGRKRFKRGIFRKNENETNQVTCSHRQLLNTWIFIMTTFK